MVEAVTSPARLRALADELRAYRPAPLGARIALLHAWGERLRDPGLADIAGLPFLHLWLRRGTLEPLATAELGAHALTGGWETSGQRRRRAFPLGVVGHWPAGNIPIQALLSLSVAFLGGNASLVRVPSGLVETMRRLTRCLESDADLAPLRAALHCVAFPHSERALHEAMAEGLDGAMLWGGQEAIDALRTLPFPHWSRVLTFGPRVSLAVMDGAAAASEATLTSWCQRLARDVWQFDQQACSSPQTLLVDERVPLPALRRALVAAFEREERAHPRLVADAALTAAIVRARQEWVMAGPERSADFPLTPAWTLLWGEGEAIPAATQGRVLTVLRCPDLRRAVEGLDAGVQTLGLALGDAATEAAIAEAAAARGVDRVVRLGHMHAFGSPWDGRRMVAELVRWAEFLPSAPSDQGRTREDVG